MSRILIVGGTGFLGAHIVAKAVAYGHDVTLTYRKSESLACLDGLFPGQPIENITLDITNEDSITNVLSKVNAEVVINAAAYGVRHEDNDVDLSIKTNVFGSLQLLNKSIQLGVDRFVHIGSCFEYGTKSLAIGEDEILEPTTIYGAAKAAASLLLRQIARAQGIEFCVVRPFGLWGPHEPEYRLVPLVLKSCLEHENLALTKCDQVRDYTYVADMAEWIIQLAQHSDFPNDEVINLGTGRSVILKDFIMKIARHMGCEKLMRFGELEYRKGEMMSLVADIERRSELLGTCEETDFEAGINEMLSGYPDEKFTGKA